MQMHSFLASSPTYIYTSTCNVVRLIVTEKILTLSSKLSLKRDLNMERAKTIATKYTHKLPHTQRFLAIESI